MTLSDLERRGRTDQICLLISRITLVWFDLQLPSYQKIVGPPICERTVRETTTKFCTVIGLDVRDIFTGSNTNSIFTYLLTYLLTYNLFAYS